MPRYMMTYISDDKAPPSPAKMDAIAKYTEEMLRSGVVLDTGGLLGISQGADVKQVNGKFSVIDGPFPETKELIVGYAICQAKNREEAIELARRFMAVAGDGVGEIRQLVGYGEEPPH